MVHPECAEVAAGSGHAGDVMVSHLDSSGCLEEEFDCHRAKELKL